MKTKTYLSALVLLLFSLLAGGSVNDDDIKAFAICFVVIVVVVGIFVGIQNAVESSNKEKRLQMIKEDEQASTDFDRSVSIGDDRCKLYFDASKNKVMIMRIMTEGITKEYVDGFDFPRKDLARYGNGIFNVYDPKSRKLLSGTYKDAKIIYDVTDFSQESKNRKTTKEAIEPFFCSMKTKNNSTLANDMTTYVLIDENHGLIAVTRNGKFKQLIYYIKEERLPTKTGCESRISVKNIGSYLFIMDDFFKVLVLISDSSHKVFNYTDIIEVSYEENGNQLFTKSTGRTVGGAIVGGVLMGGAGAVVGGLSGNSKQNKEIKSMNVKILLRNTDQTTYTLYFKDSSGVLKTKEENDRKLYEKYLKNANRAKDLLSIIIDDARQNAPQIAHVVSQPVASKSPSIADELTKLAKLKNDGILTEEEFQAQKAKLLE